MNPLFHRNHLPFSEISEVERSFLYYMFGVMNTYLEEDLDAANISWLTQPKYQQEAQLVEKLAVYFRLTFTEAEKTIYWLIWS